METINNNQFFSFDKEKVQTVTLQQLERTHRENDVYDQPLKGIYHFALINKIIEMCNEQHYNVEVYDLFAAQNRDKTAPGVVVLPQVEQQFGERAVEAHILRRVYANIRIRDFDDDGFTTNLAVAYHQRGIQVGFGNNVQICHNQCMLGADQYVSTYAERGKGRGVGAFELPQMLEVIGEWLTDARRIIITEREKIKRMRAIEVPAEQMFVIIGMLTALRIGSDTKHDEIKTGKTYPLNQAQISRFTESLMLRYAHDSKVTVWDLYNAATDLYKPDVMDIPQMLPQNRAMVNFLEEQFQFA